MQISSRLTMAVHTLLCIAYLKKKKKVTSSFIASSVGTNPVIIRNLLTQLKAADFIDVKRGTG
ncbi:MAG: Rrf2 family transcriptional regulator, partial [Megasphaera sp.]|nr:Rrf2 family transcriptional regulator [Megasphaera sp.]